MITFFKILGNWNVHICLSLAVLFLYCLYATLSRKRRSQRQPHDQKKTRIEEPHSDHIIIARKDFDWRSTPPIRLRPWKPKYHLTMGVETISLTELLEFDQSYLERLELRRSLIGQKGRSVLAYNPVASEAVLELHQWVFETYLPQRYPSMFVSLQGDDQSNIPRRASVFHNLVTEEKIILPVTSIDTALRDLGSQIDTDFLFLLPSSTSPDGQPIYHLEAYMTCFPAGFSTLSKLSKPLAEIHKPVPGYAAKLERSMDRFFARIQVGQVVKRANWSINTDPTLFRETGSHFHHAEDEEAIQAQRDQIDIEQCRLRCERQILHRLPISKALVFSFKTYQYKLDEIKDEGNGEELATAVEGLSQGNVPEINFYKRGVVWGKPVAEYLRK